LLHASNPYISIAITGLLAALFAYSWHMSSATFTERSRLQFFWLLLALIAISAELVRRQDKSSGLVLEAQPAATESTSPQTADWSQA
jgi:hypothetical protein